jgi:hypothetical protein
VERNPVDDRDEEERPMRAAFGTLRFVAVVDREEDVRRFGEVGERGLS